MGMRIAELVQDEHLWLKSIFTFSRRFYPKRLRFSLYNYYYFFFGQYVFPGNRTHNLCAADAMLYHWAAGTLVPLVGAISLTFFFFITDRFR